MLRLSIIFFSVSLLLADDLNQKSEASSSGELSPAPARNGRLFYVYTQKTTTTLITATNCWVSSTSVVACGRRKKRALVNQEDLDFDIEPAPSVVYPEDDDDLEKSVSGSLSDEDQNRENKALLYWLTTSSVATAYSYTQTFTIASLICSPSGYTVTECKSLLLYMSRFFLCMPR